MKSLWRADRLQEQKALARRVIRILETAALSWQAQARMRQKIEELRKLYDDILADEEVTTWLSDTMLLETEPMSEEDVKAHIENVKAIVNEYKDVVSQ